MASLIRRIGLHKISVPLRTNITTIFILIFVAFLGFIVWFNYSQNSKTALQAADRLMTDISEKVVERAEAHLQPLFVMAELSTELPDVRLKPEGLSHPNDLYLMRALERHTQILSFYTGFDDGDFYQIQALATDDDGIRTKLDAPDDTRFALRQIHHDEKQRLQAWAFMGPDQKVVGTSEDASVEYDPRARPWYQAATAADEVVSTDLYVFASSREVGLTVARRFDGLPGGVFGADVTLASLSDFIDRQRLSDSNLLFIFDRAGQLVAHHDKSKLSRAVGQGDEVEIKSAHVADLDHAVVNALWTEFTKSDGANAIQGVFDADGESYVARITPMPLFGADWFLAFVVPVDEFIGPIARTGTWAFLISLIAVALVIPILVMAARLISRPLNQLVHEADDIRNFRLEEPVAVPSSVMEVQRLTQAIATTKTALQTFSRYVPQALVKQLVQSGEVAEIGGQRRVITLMFSDISDFTTIVEDMPPEALMQQMSGYLHELGGAILKSGGTIDKYIGDAIMAFWNAPLTDERHAQKACLAVLECRSLAHGLNDGWAADRQPVFHTRFGLHLGDAVVGNVGSSDRMNYTAIGAAVNLAARLEGLNKYYGTEILVSETVVEAGGSDFLFRPIDLVQPKGATRPAEIFELVGALGSVAAPELQATAADQDYCTRWSQAYRAYRARDWAEAAAAFRALGDDVRGDSVAAIYAKRAASYTNDPPPPDWDGVEVFDTK